ncbi:MULTISPECIES: hypothetical protein [unclassified Caldicellulosiruptor]|uniref:hypothetical protein n=1 Tax=unclassified Caldicellulosiruptor TaxID=2622462 RepID=UPI0003A7D331|nr:MULTISPECIES: hypothetical protein [unclassified Caldicellulosiruptor]
MNKNYFQGLFFALNFKSVYQLRIVRIFYKRYVKAVIIGADYYLYNKINIAVISKYKH